MISSYKQLTSKYLKASKKRTILTIIGVVLSVALITAIGLFIVEIQNTEIDSVKSSYGSWHLKFSKVDEAMLSKITNNPKVSRSGLYSLNYKQKINDKITVDEVTATDKALELMPYKAKEGRLPLNTKEAAIEGFALKQINNNAKIGDKITFNNKQFILVGILEDTIVSQNSREGILLTKTNNIDIKNASLLVEVSDKTNLNNGVNELYKLGQKGNVQKNDYLIGFEGGGSSNSFAAIYIVVAIIIGIVVIATIAVIYNSFQIGVVERIKQFGLLRAVGATPKQIRKLILREATIIAAIGVPLGLIFGAIAMYILDLIFVLIAKDIGGFMKMVLPVNVFAISFVVGVVATYLSALIPAIFAGKISPLVAISSTMSITKEKIKRRKSTIVQKIFGFEGALS